MKIHLATFYSSDLRRSAIRFQKQAEEMGIYDYIHVFNQNDLNEDFKNYISDLLKKGKKRGYGHWVWQTYIHQLVLSKMQEGDIYHWCDVGCHFNKNGITRLKEYINIVEKDKNGFLFFSYTKPSLGNRFNNFYFPKNLEYEYTKSDLIKYFGLTFDNQIIQSPQVWGGSFFLRKCEISEKLMNDHYEITRHRYDLIDDDESKFIEKPFNGFIAHRHSQSVLSILAKKINCQFLSAYESEWALDEKGERTYHHLEFFPIIARRDKKRNILFRFIDRQKKNFNRRINKIKKIFNI
tara:strand:+ start:561 stop:1442 length:882 start_codon:yes stop_codon:yes gene_type:complete